MKCPKCDFPLLELIRRKYDRIGIVGERPLGAGEVITCYLCHRKVEGQDDGLGENMVILGNQGGIIFVCSECGHKEIKEALG